MAGSLQLMGRVERRCVKSVVMPKLLSFSSHEQPPNGTQTSVLSGLITLEMVKDCNGS